MNPINKQNMSKGTITATAAAKLIWAALLILCLAKMPYGYYQLIRIISMIGFGIMAATAYRSKNTTEIIIYLGLALLFQPFEKVALGRTLWNMVDVAIAAWLIYTVWQEHKPSVKID
jgi:hypothetical protein